MKASRPEQGKLFAPGRVRVERGVVFREKLCKTALSPSGLSDYSLNCYTGCEHACAYCYASYMKRFAGREEPWGLFVDAKVNFVSVLERELRRRKPGSVFASSVCDPYQPAEARYRLTRGALELLERSDFSVHILTKNIMARRDLDILARMGKRASLGMSIPTLDERLWRALDGRSSPPPERLKLLAEARSMGIRTSIMCAPIIPKVTGLPRLLENLFKAIAKAGVSSLMVDDFNPYPGARWRLLDALKRADPQAALELGRLLKNPAELEKETEKLRSLILEAAQKAGLGQLLKSIL
jgi:DNA repair photolyase